MGIRGMLSVAGLAAAIAAALPAPQAQAGKCVAGQTAAQPCYGIKEVMVRVFVEKAQLRQTVNFYRDLLGGRCALHFDFPERGLELAEVASEHQNVLIIAGSEEATKPFRPTAVTFHVVNLEAIIDQLQKQGAVIVGERRKVPTGTQIRFRHPDGLIVEYVEHDAAGAAYRDCRL